MLSSNKRKNNKQDDIKKRHAPNELEKKWYGYLKEAIEKDYL